MATVDNIYKMALHDSCVVSKEYISAVRVPGGWIYRINSKGLPGQTFVPYSEEFNNNDPSYQALKDQWDIMKSNNQLINGGNEKEADKTRPLEVLELFYLMGKYIPEGIDPDDCVTHIGPTDTKKSLVLTWGFEYEQHEYFHNVIINEKQLNNRYAIPILEKAKYDMQRLIK